MLVNVLLQITALVENSLGRRVVISIAMVFFTMILLPVQALDLVMGQIIVLAKRLTLENVAKISIAIISHTIPRMFALERVFARQLTTALVTLDSTV